MRNGPTTTPRPRRFPRRAARPSARRPRPGRRRSTSPAPGSTTTRCRQAACDRAATSVDTHHRAPLSRTTGSRRLTHGDLRPRNGGKCEREQEKTEEEAHEGRRTDHHPAVGARQWAARLDRLPGRSHPCGDRDAAARLLDERHPDGVTLQPERQATSSRICTAAPRRTRPARGSATVDLQRLRLEAERARPVLDHRGAEVRLVGDRADGGSSSLTSSTTSTPGFANVSRPA